MTKMSFLELARTVLFISVVLWQVTQSISLPPVSSTVTSKIVTTTKGFCGGVTCPPGKLCDLTSAGGQPECVCPSLQFCPMLDDPVCGSDGRTFGNECVLRVEVCESGRNITVQHKGRCNDSSACDTLTCPPGKSCDKDSAGQTVCVCPTICPMVEDPVCGSDGRTYGNECMLIVETCKNGTNVTMLHKGICNASCNGFECLYLGLCVIGPDDRPMCDCPIIDCLRIYRPVCGSDNRTYTSVCDLKMEACRTQTNITVIYQGDCIACSQVECPFYGECTSVAPNHTTCFCPFGCPKIYEPVCGCNNKTYTNECELRSDSCRTNTTITIHSNGRCDGGSSCDGVTCPPHKYCDLKSEGKPVCVCDEKCPDVYAPVCSSYGKTYSNRCKFDVALCQVDNNSMTVAHDGPCGTDK